MAAIRKRRLVFIASLLVVCAAVILPTGLALASTQKTIDNRGSAGEAHPTTQTPGPPLSSLSPIQASAVGSFDNISASGRRLVLNGVPHRFVGVNVYELATDWGTNVGCGPMLSNTQLNALFASLPANSLVRFWAFQGSMAINAKTHQIDWAPLDRVFAAAAAHGQRLIVSLTDQGGACDNHHWQDPSWYEGGFADVFNTASTTDGRGLTPLSYWDYLQAIVAQFRSSPALGMWEPISEPEASTCPTKYEPVDCSGHQTCPNEEAAAQALRHFFDLVGAEIHALDPNHLVEDGMLGSGQCGTAGSDYQYVSASPGIDVLSYHDYYVGSTLMGGDQWNGLGARFGQAAALDKPIVGGEMGIEGGRGPGCMSLQKRSHEFTARLQTQLAAGSSGGFLWNWMPKRTARCSFDIAPGDPVLRAIASPRFIGERRR